MRTARQVADVLERVSPRQRHLLAWYAQGYDDTQVAACLETAPQAVQVVRHSAYCALWAQLRLAGDSGHHHFLPLGGE
jgi:hypothetical protein